MKTTKYPDFWFRLFGSLFFSHLVETLGRNVSIAEQLLTRDYWYALLTGWLIAFLLWTFISVVSSRLDDRFDWLATTMPRLAWQLLLGIFLPALLVFFLSWLQVKILFDQDIIENGYHLTEFPFSVLIITLINGVYFAWYLYKRVNETPPKTTALSAPTPSYVNVLMVDSGKVQVPVAVNTIQYIQKKGEYSFIRTAERSFVSSSPLDELESVLDPSQFFRANRQVIIPFTTCKGIKSIGFGKLEVQTDPALDEPLVVSQKKARAFRDWMSNR